MGNKTVPWTMCLDKATRVFTNNRIDYIIDWQGDRVLVANLWWYHPKAYKYYKIGPRPGNRAGWLGPLSPKKFLKEVGLVF